MRVIGLQERGNQKNFETNADPYTIDLVIFTEFGEFHENSVHLGNLLSPCSEFGQKFWLNFKKNSDRQPL